MFRLSKAAEYSIRGVLYLSERSGDGPVRIEEIARRQDVPPAYLAKLFQSLARKGFVRSVRGPEGGFILTAPAERISVLDVIEAIEGPIFLNDCLIHNGYCPSEDVCPIHDVWQGAQAGFLDFLKGSSFKQLAAAGRKKRKAAGRAAKD